MNGACESLSSELYCDFLILESERKSGQGRYQKTLDKQLSSHIDRKWEHSYKILTPFH
jgi:hypothetical protein